MFGNRLGQFLERNNHRRKAPAPTADTAQVLASDTQATRPLAAAIELATELKQAHG